MKYRRLTMDELTPLENELKQFLIVHGVHSEEWAKMNTDDPSSAQKLVELFSDTVLQKVYENIQYLEHRSQNTCMVFRCQAEHIELVVLRAKDSSAIDLSTPESIHEALINQLSNLEFFTSSRRYAIEREMEIHQLFEQGCLLSTGEFWQQVQVIVRD
jgi:hypothetical protein